MTDDAPASPTRPGPGSTTAPAVWTIGHSTRSWEEFLDLLAECGIGAIADVRRFPGSRRYPWFASEAMAEQLPAAGLRYHWLPQLGGRRKPRPGSPNAAWRNTAFQGYADHLHSSEFAQGLDLVLQSARACRTALMCAEAVWWRCHRRLISDVLVHRGHEVVHILGAGQYQRHGLHPDARADGDLLVYPPVQPTLFPGGSG